MARQFHYQELALEFFTAGRLLLESTSVTDLVSVFGPTERREY